jgi:hypothetical protein
MRNIMKKINGLALAAMLIGGGYAYATQNNNPEPNVYHNGAEWLELDAEMDYQCVGTSEECTGFRESPESPVTNIKRGKFIPL